MPRPVLHTVFAIGDYFFVLGVYWAGWGWLERTTEQKMGFGAQEIDGSTSVGT